MFKRFKPKEIPSISRKEISQLFKKGDFHNSSQQCKKAGYLLGEFQNDIEAGVHKMLFSRRPGEVLSFIYKYGITVQHDVPTLLMAIFDLGDYHGFLKNAHRFKIYRRLEGNIELAIEYLMKKGQTTDAQAWKRKFKEIEGLDKS